MQNSSSIIGKRCASSNEIKSQVKQIVEKFNPEKIILFGSYAYGHPRSDSDVDLLVILKTEKSTWKMSSEIALALDHIFPLDILVKTPEQIQSRLRNGDFFLEEIMNKGKLLYERIN